jgi:hypothetical protein
MKIIINNVEFEYNIGCKLLKSKYGDDCPKWFNQPEIWDEIQPVTFKEIASSITNIESRRIAIGYLGLENLVKEIEPKLIGSETISKTTTFISGEGIPYDKDFEDTYNLYEVSGEKLGLNERDNFHYVECKDTSTDREYLIWVDSRSVFNTNNEGRHYFDNFGRQITPIQAIAWTIQTNIKEGGIEKIIRQGDCVLLKRNSTFEYGSTRHLTEKEYRELLELES